MNDNDEKSKAAAGTNSNTAIQSDTRTKSEIKLSRFNKDGAMDSGKRVRRVNEVFASQNHKNEK